jgi:hypothetical protein
MPTMLSYIPRLDLRSAEVELALITPPSQKIPQGAPRIKVLLSTPQSKIAASSAIVSAHNAASVMGPGTGATIASQIDGVQAIVSSQGGTFDALKAVITKIDIFVKVVDKAASVGG